MHSFQSLTGPSMCRHGKCLLFFDVTSCDVACFNLLFSHWMKTQKTHLVTNPKPAGHTDKHKHSTLADALADTDAYLLTLADCICRQWHN